DQSDPEISEAIDFAAYYGEQARNLDRARSEFTPHALTVVIPPWNFPVAIPAGGVTAALAAGSAVIIKPAPQTVACAEVMVDAVWNGTAWTRIWCSSCAPTRATPASVSSPTRTSTMSSSRAPRRPRSCSVPGTRG